ncbi:MAG: signal peptidase I [Peptostreptococcaceae bacterium]|nr:signal peptidase I [Peptostreptococcaceae bacterium]
MRKKLKPLYYLAGIFIVITLLYNYVYFVIYVPSASMYPTIEIGDRIITSRILDTSKIERGDILVFKSEEFSEIMVKRVIGIPNDQVEINTDGEVSVNNKKLTETYVMHPGHLSGSYKVPEGEYFFLGDYREHSLDSRKWNDPFIPENKILGQAKFILFPFNRIAVLE